MVLRPRGGGHTALTRSIDLPLDDGTIARLEHEFRTPLAAIRAIGEILRDAPDLHVQEQRALLDALLVEQGRLARTLEVLLEELVAR